jgi:hypothetical protein
MERGPFGPPWMDGSSGAGRRVHECLWCILEAAFEEGSGACSEHGACHFVGVNRKPSTPRNIPVSEKQKETRPKACLPSEKDVLWSCKNCTLSWRLVTSKPYPELAFAPKINEYRFVVQNLHVVDDLCDETAKRVTIARHSERQRTPALRDLWPHERGERTLLVKSENEII